ncbi:NUDIX hydrolase [Candidatus Uhrbacteria bacterium]|nr:NUDIX hydrolase [Candidatus Uhrbacteria bacterium]
MDPTNLFKLTACGFILDPQGRLLILKRREDDPFLPGFWQTPGGVVQPNETPEAAVERCAREDAGLETSCDKLFGYFTYADANHQRAINLNFLCSLSDPSQFVTLGQGMVDEAWSTLLELTNYNMTPELYDACRWALGKSSM